MDNSIDDLILRIKESGINTEDALVNLTELKIKFLENIMEGKNDEVLSMMNNDKLNELNRSFIKSCIIFCFITTSKCLFALLSLLHKCGKCETLRYIPIARKLESTHGSNDGSVKIIFTFEQFSTSLASGKWGFHYYDDELFMEEIRMTIHIIENASTITVLPSIVRSISALCSMKDDTRYIECFLSSKIVMDMIMKGKDLMNSILVHSAVYNFNNTLFILEKTHSIKLINNPDDKSNDILLAFISFIKEKKLTDNIINILCSVPDLNRLKGTSFLSIVILSKDPCLIKPYLNVNGICTEHDICDAIILSILDSRPLECLLSSPNLSKRAIIKVVGKLSSMKLYDSSIKLMTNVVPICDKLQ